ncbi:MAG: cytidylate kinase-like family protein [Magnetococcales bacterium]|nr:cytidylate kinase-like family protein [Magnetococcales bacterium]
MADKTSQEIIQSIVAAELYEETGEKAPRPRGIKADGTAIPLVTVSRFFGAQGTEVSRLLAERLGVQLYDRELLKAVAMEAKADPAVMEQLDEKVTGLVDDVMQSFLNKRGGTSKDMFYRAMIKVVLGIGQANGGVIVGRGAHLLLPRQKAFRLRIDGSMQKCAERVAGNLHIRKRRAKELIEQTNKDRERFTRKIYETYPVESTYYDMLISTDYFSPAQVVNIVVTAMREAGFDVPAA